MAKRSATGGGQPTLARLVVTRAGRKTLSDLGRQWAKGEFCDEAMLQQKLTEVLHSTEVVIPASKPRRRRR